MTTAAIREAVKRLDGWTVRVWLTAPVGADHRGEHTRRRGGLVGKQGHGDDRDTAGPMVGTVHLDADPDAPAFLFARPGRTSVRVLFEQVTMWQELSAPTLPTVEDVPR